MVDSATHAMTEVALGLSMSFFSLLILALLSFQLPQNSENGVVQQMQNSRPPTESTLQVSSHKGSSESSETPQLGFYFAGRLYDQTLASVEPDSFRADKPVIIAVSKSLPFADIMALRERANHPNLFITLLTEEWQQRLENL
ncbi:hypothetical protein [Planctobacterium marinum]|uniref:Uncharacterized protein n=1 Tax=Planctobacterium marinum TaxID=1631968 RepID=A0AA48HKE1_9ALTE|nr:hypothetical protein MACH26_18920 [Planctobacterium marinum]